MPDQFDGRATPSESSPKPPRIGGSQGATNDSPSNSGKPTGGLDNLRANERCLEASDSRAKSSSVRATRAAVSHFADSAV